MLIKFKKTLTATAIILSGTAASMTANAMPTKVLSIAPDLINIEKNIHVDGFTKISG